MGKKTGKKGPDPIEIPEDQAFHLAEVGWKNVWIAAHFGVHVETLTAKIPAEKLHEARLKGVGKLMQKAHMVAMGGKTEKVNPDGSKTVTYLQSSNDMLKFMIERRMGKLSQVMELNPDPERPVNIKADVTEKAVRVAIEKFNAEY